MPREISERYLSVAQKFYREIEHPYLKTNQVLQTPSRFHFEVGLGILKAASVPEHQWDLILTALLLLQKGLSMHDEIDEKINRTRQLTILAGDFHSSQYYRLIAQTGEFPLMDLLAVSVAEMNEAKMTLLISQQKLSLEEQKQLRIIIEGRLLEALAEYYLRHETHWKSDIRSLVEAYILHTDIEFKKFNLRPAHLRQAYDCLTNILDRVWAHSPISLDDPLHALLMDYIQPIQELLEVRQWVEGSS
ncbi:heptaprenyl diphosphate synthase component 1 [Alicyclobacillus tolerans]|uniref:Heptaprenyl diphosphate synthase n=1 Tax=Alicyclobacillus tolerans TaxID=90970 RepID=A0ABT9LZZ9_9BACL|nr:MULTISPECIES: heptaprenyl diphosphate synthase component 1 [Alicyclobacillus]MDP9729850.1 hypothetical protein [Alicyclobacillus tengchongensis]QRF23331.1 hypothetical protein FY534_06365 [Alicyclobacillus sp. TC]